MSNLPDYEGYEQLGGFTAPQLVDYRLSLIEKTRPQVDFILNHLPTRPLNVVEIGTGNGRLLIGLANRAQQGRGVLNRGVGIDLSHSRISFARAWRDAWAAYLQYSVLDFFQDDVLTTPSKYYGDLAVCITGCFQYFYPASPEGPATVLEYMRISAEYSLFELYKRPPMGRTWHKLDKADRWRYILDDYEDVGDWVRHTKTFISADGKEDVRVENLAYYTSDVFLSHLRKAGFTELLWLGEDAERIVVLVK